MGTQEILNYLRGHWASTQSPWAELSLLGMGGKCKSSVQRSLAVPSHTKNGFSSSPGNPQCTHTLLMENVTPKSFLFAVPYCKVKLLKQLHRKIKSCCSCSQGWTHNLSAHNCCTHIKGVPQKWDFFWDPVFLLKMQVPSFVPISFWIFFLLPRDQI